MNINTEVIKWSETKKRVELQIEEKEGDGFFIPEKIVCGYKLFALGSEESLGKYEGNEKALAKMIVAGRQKWLKNIGKRYYSFPIEKEGINVKIYKSKYYES